MADDEKKAVEPEGEKKAVELDDEDLEEVAGGFIYIPSLIDSDPEARERWLQNRY